MSKCKKWACKYGCDLSKVACEHLEALLPNMNAGKTKYVGDEAAAQSSISIFNVIFPPTSPKIMLERVRNYGILDKWQLELLEAKYFHNLSIKDITAKFGWTSETTVKRRLREIRAILKDRGYEQEME